MKLRLATQSLTLTLKIGEFLLTALQILAT